MIKAICLALVLLFALPLLSPAGPTCGEDNYNEERFQAIQTKHIDGYRFDITNLYPQG